MPQECRSKRVIRLAVELRIKQLGSFFIYLTMEDEMILVTGKVNYAKLGIYRPTTY